MKSSYLLYAVTIFLSSFLLFQIQPLLGKHILAWYGGSSAVWVTAMFFFMVALAVGYVYALFLSYIRPLYQVTVHGLIVVATLASLYTHAKVWPSSITPTANDIAISFSEPVWGVFLTLLITIGLPFTLLSSTSSLLQVWYAKLSGKEPFSLYSISNVGSLLGLLSYPLFFEPFLSTHEQGVMWSYGLVLYVILLGLVLFNVLSHSRKSPVISSVPLLKKETSPSLRLFFIWLLIASVPVMVLLAGTSFMTISIAPIPFLWVGPLALYLLSFVFTFREGDRLPEWVNELAVMSAAMLTLILVVLAEARVVVTILVTHVALFAISHWCHEYLYTLRPKVEHLTRFYVALSLGGILGSIVIKISSSYLLVMPIELMLILIFSTIAIAYRWFRVADYHVPFVSKIHLRGLALMIVVVMVGSSYLHIYNKQLSVIAQERNFFGYKAVIDHTDDKVPLWSMQHGLTNHGYQVFAAGELVVKPVSYYGSSSGVAKAFAYIRGQDKETPRIVVAGLGSGGLAAYCRPEDDFAFLEIDEEVIFLAKEYFTYLESCPNHTVTLGDARLVLETKEEGKYDLIILDAYADDMMPVHLMTTEAIALYKSLLSPDGLIAIHISSRYLNLLPVLKALAKDNELSGRYLFDRSPVEDTATASNWVILSPQEEVFEHKAFSTTERFPEDLKPILWTDTYSALLPIVRF